MAVAVVLSVVFSLILGLAAGYFIAIRRHSTIYKVKKESLSVSCQNEKKQNVYDIDDGTPHHNCNERCSALPNGKQCSVLNSEPKANNSVNGVSQADILDRRKKAVHL